MQPAAKLKVIVILNATAGTKQASGGASIQQAVAAEFETQDIAAEIELPDPAKLVDAAKLALARVRRKEVSAVVVGGGDGTVRAIAAVLAGSDVPLGILPLGTLNHFAKDLGIPLELEEAVRVIGERHIRMVDLGEVNGERFVNNSSIGIYPYMVLDRDRRQKMQGMAKWTAMALAFLRVMRSFPRRRIMVRAEGTAEAFRTPCLFVGNNQYGTHVFGLGKRDRLDAGELWLYIAKPRNPAGFLLLAGRMALGAVDAGRDLTTLRVQSAEILAAASRLPVALDGEVAMLQTPLRYKIQPKALAVFAPLPAAGAKEP